jgi:prevent-host-death family protein
LVKIISQRELRNSFAPVMDAVEAGETFHVTCNGVEIAELRPLSQRRRLTAEELVAKHRRLPRVDGQRADRNLDGRISPRPGRGHELLGPRLSHRKLGAAIADFTPLPFDGEAATRYGTFVAMVLAVERDPRPRKMDLMIAATASVHGLPLYTRNAKDFKGLESLLEVVEV